MVDGGSLVRTALVADASCLALLESQGLLEVSVRNIELGMPTFEVVVSIAQRR